MLNPIYKPIITRNFFLQPDVFVALGKDAGVLLKLKTDKYQALDTAQTTALSLMVPGWPALKDAPEVSAEEASEFADNLVKKGLLTRDHSVGKAFPPLAMEHPEDAMVYRHEREVPAAIWRHVPAFVVSLVSGFFWWKFRPFDKMIRHVERRKPKHTSASGPVDIAKLRNLIRVFYCVRPFFYEKQRQDPKKKAGLCLFDSLVMLAFLSKYRLYPTLVIAVRIRPFAGHSWLQEGRWILNGTPEVTSDYEVIMTATRREA